ncbi:putative lipoprotein, partial [Leptospira interrogans serovar Canicola str. Fiocruz LV133]
MGKLKVFKKRFVFVFLILSISLVFFSCAGYSYEGYYPVPITTSENTYIRFRFENKRSEEEKQLL